MNKRTLKIIEIMIGLALAVPIFFGGCTDDGDKAGKPDEKVKTQTAVKARPDSPADASVDKVNPGTSAGDMENKTPRIVVAKVNGHEITKEEYQREIDRLTQIYLKMGAAPGAGLEDLKKHALDNLISRDLVFQECEKTDLKIDDRMVDDELEKVFPDEEAFRKYLKQVNVGEEEFRKAIHTNVAITTFINEKFYNNISIPDEEVKQYYDRNLMIFVQPEAVHASHILISLDRKAGDEKKAEARKKIEEIKKKLDEGGDFASLAKEFSQCPSKNKGGDLGYFGRNKMVESFEKAAFSTIPGETSGIVESQFGFHIIKVHDKKDRNTKSYEDVKEQIRQRLEKQKVDEELDKFIMAVRKNSDIEIFITFDREDHQARAGHTYEREEKIN